MWDCAEKMKLCDSASTHNSVGPVHGNTELSFARYLLRFGGGKCFSLWSISVMNLVLHVIIGFSIAEYSVGVGRCWRPVNNGEGRVSLKYKHMQCTCVRCYNFYHPAPPSIYASLTLLSKSRLPYPCLSHPLSKSQLPYPSIHPSIHPSIYPCLCHPLSKSHFTLHPHIHPYVHPSMGLTSPCPSLISPMPLTSHYPSFIFPFHPSMPLLPPCPSPISPIHPCLSHSPCQVFTILYICLTL